MRPREEPLAAASEVGEEGGGAVGWGVGGRQDSGLIILPFSPWLTSSLRTDGDD